MSFNTSGGKSIYSEKRFSIDHKLIKLVAIFVVAGFVLMIISNLATTTMTSLRAYTSLQAEWTREWKEVKFNLDRYIDSANPVYADRIEESMQFIHHATTIREELEKSEPDYPKVREAMLSVNTSRPDITGMIRTYEWLHTLKYFDQIVVVWEKIDGFAYRMVSMSEQVRESYAQGDTPSAGERTRLKKRLENIDEHMAGLQMELHNLLGKGMRLLKNIVFWSTMGFGVLLFCLGIVVTFRFRNSLKKWRHSLKKSEQRYRSLFDQNPNAVFSLDPEGQFLAGNKALEQMTGYQNEELQEMTYLPLVYPEHREFVEERFVQALNGTPQSYESKGIHKDGTEYHVYVSNLPIIVDGKIEGVYGIAQDITERKRASQKLQDSLEEKKTLLAEIHHRVKNNLAIISGLLELQADGLNENKLKYDLKNTQSRIHSMAIVHEILYNSRSLSSINMPDYVKDLTRSIRQTINVNTDIKFEYDVDDVELDITQAIPCGLLMNEMVVNSFKYAFEDREQGTIGIEMEQVQQEARLKVYDDGIGLPEDINIDTSTSLGLKLIDTLTQQLNGTLEIDRSSGTEYTISFPIKEKKFLPTM